MVIDMTEEKFKKKLEKIKEKNKEIKFKNKLKAEKNKYKRKMSTSNKVLIASIMAILVFTIACLYIQCATSMEVSSTLITLWYSFWTVEILSLAGIKISKVIKNYDTTSDVEIETEDENVG